MWKFKLNSSKQWAGFPSALIFLEWAGFPSAHIFVVVTDKFIEQLYYYNKQRETDI